MFDGMPVLLIALGVLGFVVLTLVMVFDFMTATEALIETLINWWEKLIKKLKGK